MIEDDIDNCDPNCPSCCLRRVLGLLRGDRSRSYSEEVVTGLTYGELLAAVESGQDFMEQLLLDLDHARAELDDFYDEEYPDDDDDDFAYCEDDDEADMRWDDGEG